MFVTMKKIILLITFVIHSVYIFSQDNSIHAAMKMDQFIRIPAAKNNPNQKPFLLMREPVLAKDFQEFLNYLYSQNSVLEANVCMTAIAKDLNIPSNYVILSNPDPIVMYANYLSKRMSTKSKKVTYQLVTETQWEQAKGMPDTYDLPKKNPNGLIFQHGIFEWKLNKKGKMNTFADINGYVRSGFRLVYTESTMNTNNKK